jgi:dTDP-glucose 4,6-dehydratase
MDSCRKAGTKKFIQIGTDEVYGDILSGRSRESDPLKPNSPYAASKAAADLLALAYYRTYSFPVTVVRSSNNFGPYQYPEKVIPLFITNLLEGRKVPLYGTGKNVREWLFVKDNCAAIDLVLRDGEIGSIYNIGGGNDLSNLDLTGKILATMDRGEDCIEHVKDRPGHDMRYSLDSSRIKELGWEPSDDMQKDLEYTVNWYSENTSWWKPLKEKAEIINW